MCILCVCVARSKHTHRLIYRPVIPAEKWSVATECCYPSVSTAWAPGGGWFRFRDSCRVGVPLFTRWRFFFFKSTKTSTKTSEFRVDAGSSSSAGESVKKQKKTKNTLPGLVHCKVDFLYTFRFFRKFHPDLLKRLLFEIYFKKANGGFINKKRSPPQKNKRERKKKKKKKKAEVLTVMAML